MTEEERLKQINDKYDKIYEEKYAGRNLHNEPSPETRERLAKLEVSQSNIMEKLNEFQVINEKAHEAIMEVVNKMDAKLDSALEKKADKESQWAEGVLKWAGAIIGAGLLAYLGSLIIRVIEKL